MSETGAPTQINLFTGVATFGTFVETVGPGEEVTPGGGAGACADAAIEMTDITMIRSAFVNVDFVFILLRGFISVLLRNTFSICFFFFSKKHIY
jgi:hypothetical protein